MNHLQPLWFSFSFSFSVSVLSFFLIGSSHFVRCLLLVTGVALHHFKRIHFSTWFSDSGFSPHLTTQRAFYSSRAHINRNISMPNETSKLMYTKSHPFIHSANEPRLKRIEMIFAFEIDATIDFIIWFHDSLRIFCSDFKFIHFDIDLIELLLKLGWIFIKMNNHTKRQMKTTYKRKKNETFYFEVKHAHESRWTELCKIYISE